MPWRAPTWSWAGIRSPVMWPSSGHFESYPGLRVVNVSTRPKGQDEFGEIVEAVLELQGLLHKLNVTMADDKTVARVAGRDLELIADFEWYSEHNSKAINEDLWYLPVGRHHSRTDMGSKEGQDVALVLLRSPDVDGTFERIGLIFRVVNPQDAIEWTTEAEHPKDCIIRIV